MNSIILKTERLRLELISERHFESLYKLLSNPEVHRHFTKTLNRKESEEFFEKIQSRYKTDGYCFWAVIRRSDNIFMGICGLLQQKIDGQNETEIGYRLSDEYWSRGYGTEAAGGCVKYAVEKRNSPSVISLIRPANIASKRVAEKNGLSFEKESIFQDLPHHVYRLFLR